jgi:tetratricopeptide (TPR) repeat protein
LQERLEYLASEAQEAQRAGDYRKAAQCYEQILRLQPDIAEVRANLGLMHHLLEEYPAAIREFDAALRKNPNLFVPNLFLGTDLARQNQSQRAVPYLLRAHRLKPWEAEPVLVLGRTYLALRDYEKAAQWYETASRLAPRNADAWYGLGLAHLHLQEDVVARLGKGGVNSPYFHILLAQSFVQQGRLADATEAYRRVLASAAKVPCLHSDLGYALDLKGDLPGAEKEFRSDLDSPCRVAARFGLARLAFERGDFERGFTDVRTAWKADPNFVAQNVGRLWEGSNVEQARKLDYSLNALRPESADAEIQSLLLESLRGGSSPTGMYPTPSRDNFKRHEYSVRWTASQTVLSNPAELFAKGHYTACTEVLKPKLEKLSTPDSMLLAACAFYSGHYDTSSLVSAGVLRNDPTNLQALYWRAKAEERLAVGALTQAGAAAPQSPRLHLLLGDLYRDQSRYKEAKEEYGKVLALQADNPAAHFGLAATFYHDFHFDEAARELRKVLAATPSDPDAGFLMAEILVYQHQYEQAEPYLVLALRGQPATLPRVHGLLGKVYAERGQTWRAVNEYKQALADDPDGSLHFRISRLYLKLGDKQAAEVALKESESIRKARAGRQQQNLSAIER